LGIQEVASLSVSFTKPFHGELNYRIGGDALKGVHFAPVNGETASDGYLAGSVSVNGTATSIPIQALSRDEFSGKRSLIISLTGYQSVADESGRLALSGSEGLRVRQESDNSLWEYDSGSGWSKIQDSFYDIGSGSVHRVDILEADRGLYSGLMRFQTRFHLPAQRFQIAVRSDGTATFDVSASTLFPESFSVPVQLSQDGAYSFGGASTGAPRLLSSVLGRTVTWQMTLDEPQVVRTVPDDMARLALTSSEVSAGDLVAQTDIGGELSRVSDVTKIDSEAGWESVVSTDPGINVFLDLPAGLSALPGGLTIFGVLELLEQEAPLIALP
jgi:hypothetical protein